MRFWMIAGKSPGLGTSKQSPPLRDVAQGAPPVIARAIAVRANRHRMDHSPGRPQSTGGSTASAPVLHRPSDAKTTMLVPLVLLPDVTSVRAS